MKRARCGGFSLIEVVVAFAILSISLTVLYRVFALAAQQATRVEDHASALALAQARLTEGERSLASAEGEETAGGFRWRRIVEPYAAFAARAPEAGIAPLRIAVEVRWVRGGQPYSVSLDTVRLGRAP